MSSNDVCLATFRSAVDSQCLKNCICLCFVSDGLSLSLSISSTSANSWRTLSCRHVYLPWFTATCHPDKICNIIWSLSFQRPYSLGLHFFPIVASLHRIGLSHILTSVRMIFFTSLFSENLSRLTLALASPTSFRHPISSSIMGFFLWSSHVRLLQPEA